MSNTAFAVSATFNESLKAGTYYLLQVTGSTGAVPDLQVISQTFVGGGSRVPISISPGLDLSGSVKGANPHKSARMNLLPPMPS